MFFLLFIGYRGSTGFGALSYDHAAALSVDTHSSRGAPTQER